MSLALVCDSMSAYGGAERVIEQILKIYPEADVYALLDLVPKSDRAFLGQRQVTTSFLQKMPRAGLYYRKLLNLWSIAIEQLDLSKYDLVISSHHSVANGVITHPYQVHVSYIHSPMRYAWDLQHEYLALSNLERGPFSWWARRVLHRARLWDFAAGQRPDVLIANSYFVQERIQKYYRRASTVVYPPVFVDRFRPRAIGTGRFYLSVSRLVPYKRVDLLVEAFARMPTRHLKIIGAGPEMSKLRKLAPANVEFLGHRSDAEVEQHMAAARALLFAGVEDFGITLVEAQAAGVPVIAYGKGGAVEIVRALDGPGATGLLVDRQSPEAFVTAIEDFEKRRHIIAPGHCRRNAARFAEDRFRAEFAAVVERSIKRHKPDATQAVTAEPAERARP